MDTTKTTIARRIAKGEWQYLVMAVRDLRGRYDMASMDYETHVDPPKATYGRQKDSLYLRKRSLNRYLRKNVGEVTPEVEKEAESWWREKLSVRKPADVVVQMAARLPLLREYIPLMDDDDLAESEASSFYGYHGDGGCDLHPIFVESIRNARQEIEENIGKGLTLYSYMGMFGWGKKGEYPLN